MRRNLVIAALVFVAALAVLAALRSAGALHPPFQRQAAVHAATSNPAVAAYLRGHAWSQAQVIALDESNWRVTFSDGPRLVLDVAIGPHGTVTAAQAHPPGSHPPGSKTLWTPAIVVLLSALFFFAVATEPLVTARNLDALVLAAGFALSELLLDGRLIGPQVYVGDAVLAYLAYRLARVGFSHPEQAVARDPLYGRLIHSDRVVTVLTGGLLAAAFVVVVASTGPSDVAFAGMAGATLLNHGVIPYGHLPDIVVHGDTYPLLSYVLYMPFAALSPVHAAADSLDGALWLNAIALAVGTTLLALRSARAHALAWLAFPPVLLAASAGGNDVPAAALVIGAIVTYERAATSAGLMTLAAWVKVVPLAPLVPWLARLRGASLRRAAVTVAVLVVAGVVAIALIGGAGAVGDAWRAMRFQFVRGSWYSVWQQTGTRPLQTVFQAATLGFAALAALELARTDQPTLRRAAAFAGAILALLQISGNYWTYTYLPWLLPFILVALFPAAPRRSPRPAQPVP